MNTYTIIISSTGVYRGQQLDLPENFTVADVNDAVKQKFGQEYGFYGVYPYGPYKRVVSQTLSLVLREEA